ncbi:MAG TPA: non-ribosomal peptide synthetase, partial [Acidobacteria bacterium]|nr:non-ribosomal peptide synthetase [Acidobacteriota bacterium]
MTAERFRPDSLAETPGARLYHTGDLARRRPSGAVELLGRADGQVKIRGQRIEPGEIEAHLLALPGVCEAVVGAREGAPGDRHLVAWIAAAPELDLRALRAALARRLPEALLPAAFVVLDRLPRLPSGKLDRRSLPEPAAQEEAAPSPADAVERALCDLFREVLGAGRVDPGADFFALGGHSLLA